MTEYAPKAIQKLFDTVNARMPSALMGGIIGDKAHTYGYHRGRNYVGSGDYSVQKPPDKKGPGEAACGLDISWNRAEDQYTASKRLLNAKNDPRMDCIREFYGSTDGRNVCGWDYYGNYAVTSDDSHLWHIHISVLREFCENEAKLQAVADVITGVGSSGGGGGDEDVPKHIALGRAGKITVRPGENWDLKWDIVDFDPENKFPGSDGGDPVARINLDGAYYVSTFTCSLETPKDQWNIGDVVHTAMVYCDLQGNNTGQSSWLEHLVGTNEGTEISDVRSYRTSPGKGVKVRIKSPKQVVLSNLQWRMHYWNF